MTRNEIMTILMVFAMMLLCIVGNADADETEKIICEIESPVDGISGSFGFTMAYVGEATILENTTIDLSYSPSPENATIIIDIVELLEKYKPYDDLRHLVKNALKLRNIYSWDNLPDELKKLELPINDTPLGTFTFEIMKVPIVSGANLILDMNINSQINTTLETTGGSLSEDRFEWHNWGAKEITLTPLTIDNYYEVVASFEYYVSMQIVLRLDAGKIYNEPLFTTGAFPLKEMPFNRTVTSKIIIDKSHTKIKELEAELTISNMEISGLKAELLTANTVIGNLDASLSKANGEIDSLTVTLTNLNLENKNLSQTLNESIIETNELNAEIIKDAKEENNYLIPTLSIAFLIMIIFLFINYGVMLKKKKIEPRPQYDDNRQPLRHDEYQLPTAQYDDWQKPSPESFRPQGVANFFIWEDEFERLDVGHPKDQTKWENDFYDFDDEWMGV